MTTPSAKREGLGLVGIGAAACAACCAGPILAFLGGLTLAGIASTLIIGVAGLALAAIAATAWLIVKRRNRDRCTPVRAGEPVPMNAPTTRRPR